MRHGRRGPRTEGPAGRPVDRLGVADGRPVRRGRRESVGCVVHRLSSASGACRTGLSSLIELTAASSVGDAFVAVSLAGTLFFSASAVEARGRVALALLITIAPFAILAPFLGPMLDRVQQGRRYILMGTLLARGLLCWGMAGAVQHNDTLTLLGAAFGVLVLQKAYGVTRAAVTPRLLPSEITLVSANARSALGSLVATSLGAGAAAGVSYVFGGGTGGAAWVLRIGTAVYLAAMVLALRLPDGVDAPKPALSALDAPADSPLKPGDTWPETPVPGEYAGQEQYAGHDGPQRSEDRPGPGGARPAPAGRGSGRTGLRRLFSHAHDRARSSARLGNAALRAFSGFLILYLAFLLRTKPSSPGTPTRSRSALLAAAALGGLVGTARRRGASARRWPSCSARLLATVTARCARCSSGCGRAGGRVRRRARPVAGQARLDAIVQREIGEEVRSSTFAVSETIHQLVWVVGGLVGLVMSMADNGPGWLVAARRARGGAGLAAAGPAAPDPDAPHGAAPSAGSAASSRRRRAAELRRSMSSATARSTHRSSWRPCRRGACPGGRCWRCRRAA